MGRAACRLRHNNNIGPAEPGENETCGVTAESFSALDALTPKSRPKVAYITAEAPYGCGETFVTAEMLAITRAGVELTVIPRSPRQDIFHDDGRALVERTVRLPLINAAIARAFMRAILGDRRLWRIIYHIVRESRSALIFVKNLAVIPKGVFVAGLLRQKGVEHIHAHWGSTTATLAYIAAHLAGIPWSFTVHRWDIDEDNMLREKARSAAFVRTISGIGLGRLRHIIGEDLSRKCRLIHVGVDIAGITGRMVSGAGSAEQKDRRTFTVACPANMLPVKGHRYLIEACRLLHKRGVAFACWLFGDGLLEHDLRSKVSSLGLSGVVEFKGRLRHEALLDLYAQGTIDVVVLPSIETAAGVSEGIPVSLIEAMAAGIAVVSTSTGGIPELITDGTGLLVAEKDGRALADALERLASNSDHRETLGGLARSRVERDFDLEVLVKDMLSLMFAY